MLPGQLSVPVFLYAELAWTMGNGVKTVNMEWCSSGFWWKWPLERTKLLSLKKGPFLELERGNWSRARKSLKNCYDRLRKTALAVVVDAQVPVLVFAIFWFRFGTPEGTYRVVHVLYLPTSPSNSWRNDTRWGLLCPTYTGRGQPEASMTFTLRAYSSSQAVQSIGSTAKPMNPWNESISEGKRW